MSLSAIMVPLKAERRLIGAGHAQVKTAPSGAMGGGWGAAPVRGPFSNELTHAPRHRRSHASTPGSGDPEAQFRKAADRAIRMLKCGGLHATFAGSSHGEKALRAMPEPDNLVLQLIREMRGDIADVRGKMATKDDAGDLRSEVRSLRADVASDIHSLDAKIDTTRQELSGQIVGLRRAVVEYHSAVIGHGVLISELEARVRRIEQRLEMPPIEA